jgi:RimJ/RimL family protein N-acetyltransferase
MPPVDADPAPELRLGHVVLRPHRWSDLADIVLCGRDPQVQAWTLMPHPYAEDDARDYLARCLGSEIDGETRWAISTVDDDRLQGNLGLISDGAGAMSVGYYVAPWARRRRLGTVALWLACEWAFGAGGAQVVFWDALVGNGPSRRMAERVGFRVHADVTRLRAVQRGVRRDEWTGDLLPEDLVAGETLVAGSSRP